MAGTCQEYSFSFLPVATCLIEHGVKTLGKHALRTGVNIATDYLDGKNFKTSAKRGLKEIGSRLGQAVRKMPVREKEEESIKEIMQ